MHTDYIHRTAKQLFQELLQPYKQIHIWLHLHADIHIAILRMFISSYRAKYTERTDTKLFFQFRDMSPK